MNDKSKYELAKTSFDHIMKMNLHLDGKAGRTLSAMAFLSAAAAAVYANSLINRDQISFGDFLTDLIPPLNVASQGVLLNLGVNTISFSLYLLGIMIGASIYLRALGPKIEWKGEKPESVETVLYFDKIAAYPLDSWQKHWEENSAEQLHDQTTENYIKESWIVSNKTEKKFKWMQWGNFIFRISLFLTIPLIASLVSDDSDSLVLFSLFGWALLLLLNSISEYITERFSNPFIFFLVSGAVFAILFLWKLNS